MKCAWKELTDILPPWMRCQIAQYENASVEEIRLRINSPPELIMGRRSIWLTRKLTPQDLAFCINAACQYSPWAASTAAQGYITAPGGHRIGICGSAIMKDNCFMGVRVPSSLCIRVARDLPGIAASVTSEHASILILGAPGWGKTTMLRDLARKFSEKQLVSVVDERQELFPVGISTGKRMDILSGCPKSKGIEIVLRTMGPQCIAVDEITAEEDCNALIHAYGCGVKLLATAHASGMKDFCSRNVYIPLRNAKIFDTYLILKKDKSFVMEEAG